MPTFTGPQIESRMDSTTSAIRDHTERAAVLDRQITRKELEVRELKRSRNRVESSMGDLREEERLLGQLFLIARARIPYDSRN